MQVFVELEIQAGFIGKKEDSVTVTREETFTDEHRNLTTFIY